DIRYTRLIWKRARRFIFFDPHVLVCTLRSKNMKRLALFQIKLRLLFILIVNFLKYLGTKHV
ncbi:MAG: hypothetical protein AB8V26_07700, partial [Rickettsia conorii subsp. raoultii]